MQESITISDAPSVLNTNDKAMWVLGYQAAIEAHKPCLHQIQDPAVNQQLTTEQYLGTVNDSTPRTVDWHSHFVPEAGTKLYAAPVLAAQPEAIAELSEQIERLCDGIEHYRDTAPWSEADDEEITAARALVAKYASQAAPAAVDGGHHVDG